jgi:hypothetical protein
MTMELPELTVALNSETHPSDSAAQRIVERGILRRFSAEHPEWQPVTWSVVADELGLSSVWKNAQPDAVWKNGPNELIVAECYARIGVLKPGQNRKLAMDALKLMALCRQVPDAKRLRCFIIVPEELRNQLAREGWFCVALRMAAEIMPIALTDHERKLLADATQRQADGQSRSRK